MCHDETGDGKFAITRHLSSHMEEISLAALPAGIDLDNDSDLDSAVEDKSEDTEECHRCNIRKNRTDMTSRYTMNGSYATVWECRECGPSRSKIPSPAISVDSYSMQRTAESKASVQPRVDERDLLIPDNAKEQDQITEEEGAVDLVTPPASRTDLVVPATREIPADVPDNEARPQGNTDDDYQARCSEALYSPNFHYVLVTERPTAFICE